MTFCLLSGSITRTPTLERNGRDRRGDPQASQHRSDAASDKAISSAGELLASLGETQALYDRHRRVCHAL